MKQLKPDTTCIHAGYEPKNGEPRVVDVYKRQQKKMCSNADKWKLTAKFSQLKVPALWRCCLLYTSTMAVKSHLRNSGPVVLALATNDALSGLSLIHI